MFGAKPIQLLRLLEPGIRFPKKLRTIFSCLWFERDLKKKEAHRFIIKGPRGGGKSKILGSLGFSKWFLQTRSIVDMGGSLEQAKNVYNYFSNHCYAHDSIVGNLPTEPTMQRTESDLGNYFKAVAASPKQIRGPHPDVLMIDEACETKDELILSALPMVNTSSHSMVIMTSTFHKIFGLFQETWDKADEQGYVRLSWDAFDVTMSFDPKMWDDPELKKNIPDLNLLKKRANGRTGDPEGWIPVENLLQAWRGKPTIDWFDVEYMGSRPSASGMVNDPADIDACVVEPDDMDLYAYVEGAEVVGGLDWGYSSMTAWEAFMSHQNGIKAQVACKNWSQVDDADIIAVIVEDVVKFGIEVIYADSAGKFSNSALQKALNLRLDPLKRKCVVIERVFGKDKEVMLGNYRTYWQRKAIRIPSAYVEAIWQHKRYRYQPGSDKPVKKDDHHPDATMCALYHWPIGQAVASISDFMNPVKVPTKRKSKLIDADQLVEDATERDRRDLDDSSAPFGGGLLEEIF